MTQNEIDSFIQVSSERTVKTLVLKGVTGTTVPTNAPARMAATAPTRTVNVRARPVGRVCFASCRAEPVFSAKDARILVRARTAHLVTTSRVRKPFVFECFMVFFFGLGRDVCQSPKCCPLWRYCSRPNNNSLMRWCCWIVMQEHARAAPDIEDPLVTPLALKGDSGWIANRLAIAKRTTPSSATWKREFANAKLISEVSIHFLLPFTALNYADRFPSGALPLRTLIFAVFDRPFYLLSCLRVSMIPLIPDGSLAAELCPSFSHFSPPAP